MFKNSTIGKAFIAASLGVAALTAPTAAMALDRGCQNADVVRQALKDEGQFVLVTGVGTIPEAPKNIFTSNANGTLGYNIEQGTGDAVGELCVRVKYTDIKVNPNTDSTPPSWALFGANTSHDQWLAKVQASANDRVLMGATVLRNVNGQDIRGGFMMVVRGDSLNTSFSSTGAVSLTVNGGSITPILVLGNVEKSQPNYNMFAGTSTPQLASLDRH